jgi:hypothetical protein
MVAKMSVPLFGGCISAKGGNYACGLQGSYEMHDSTAEWLRLQNHRLKRRQNLIVDQIRRAMVAVKMAKVLLGEPDAPFHSVGVSLVKRIRSGYLPTSRPAHLLLLGQDEECSTWCIGLATVPTALCLPCGLGGGLCIWPPSISNRRQLPCGLSPQGRCIAVDH